MLSTYKESIDKALDAYLASLPNYPIYDPIRYIVNLGGKRFRSSLTLMISELFCGNPLLAINESMAIELFHNFTLIHDDIMDKASLRREIPLAVLLELMTKMQEVGEEATPDAVKSTT